MIDHEFTSNKIEEAFLCLNDSCNNHESAITFLNEWSEQPDSIFSALDIIQTSDNPISHFICSSLIKNNIANYWNQIDTEQKIQYRDSLTSIIYSSTDINSNIMFNLVHSLCTIAIFDWPNEFPTFSEIFNRHEDSEDAIIRIRILSSFLGEVDCTNIITDKYRNELRQLIKDQYFEQIEFIIKHYILLPDLSNDILSICNYTIKWSSVNDILDMELFEQILTFLTNENTWEKVVECLNSIFLDNEDDEDILCTYSPYMFHSLATSISQLDFSIFSLFLINFLKSYTKQYDSLYSLNNYNEIDSTIFNTDNYPLLGKLSNNLKEYGFDTETVINDILILFDAVFSIPPDEINDDLRSSYKNLCTFLLNNISYSKQADQLPPEKVSIYISFYDELFQFIYNSQNYFDYYEYQIEDRMSLLICEVYEIDTDYFIDFLREQPPTPQLCWSIGSIFNQVDESKQEIFISILIDLIENLENDQSPEFLSSLLYSLSKWTNCFNLDNQLFDKFNHLIFDVLTKNDEKLSNCASSYFHSIVLNHIELFKNDCLDYIELITSNCFEYLSNLPEKSSENLIVSCTKLIRYYKHLVKQSKSDELKKIDAIQLYEKLFEPFIQILNSVNEFQPETVEASLNIIGKVCILSNETANDLVGIIWPHLNQLAYDTIPDPSISSKLIELILNAIAKIQVKFDYDEISPQVEEIFTLMTQRGRVEECFFIYFAKLKIQFDDLDENYDQISQQIILPFISQENAVSSEIFKMIEKFSTKVIDIEWFTEILIETINNMSTDVVYTALNTFIYIITDSFPFSQKALFLKNLEPELMKTIIAAILDLLHKPLLFKFSEVIFEIINLPNKTNYEFEEEEEEDGENDDDEEHDIDLLNSIVKSSISSSLIELAPEPQSGFFDNFVEFLYENDDSAQEIMTAFSNLLIILKKATPCDLNDFRVEKNDDEFYDDNDPDLNFLVDDICHDDNDLL